MALRSLSNDVSFVERTEALLDLEARLKLLKRMACVRNLDSSLIAKLDGLSVQARNLRDKRDELSRFGLIAIDEGNATSEVVGKIEGESIRPTATARQEALRNRWLPTMAEIDECSSGTTSLQSILRLVTEQVQDHNLLAGNV